MSSLIISIICFLFQLSSDVESRITERHTKLAAYGLTVQPFIIISGPVSNPEGFFVCVNRTIWKVSSLFEALTTCFQTFNVLSIDYPVESQYFWLIVQRGLYKFKTAFDKNDSVVATNVHALERQSAQNEKTDAAPPEKELPPDHSESDQDN